MVASSWLVLEDVPCVTQSLPLSLDLHFFASSVAKYWLQSLPPWPSFLNWKAVYHRARGIILDCVNPIKWSQPCLTAFRNISRVSGLSTGHEPWFTKTDSYGGWQSQKFEAWESVGISCLLQFDNLLGKIKEAWACPRLRAASFAILCLGNAFWCIRMAETTSAALPV